ncbi:KAP family P-loop domain-containing protein [Curtobacterium sp. UNCCL20]|uniref:KAP family P-loop NTPase fold protein n=1 Tax=Curtobacterium sp. UNCCL20 TaxID=1502773 RepID=UPI0008817473|nr:P-loop NTPase fold protein [Curtobacterium sp. UNCCL20]SDQ14128.1 KAP family P-loop domain-containing protein [Curtobacterium sp. UNCCL20]
MSEQPELIRDAEIQDPTQDRLGHVELTAGLLTLIAQTGTPANIALFGSWGSGKSGIGRLLRAEIENGYSKKMRFARFDAFKYAQNPLRRNFISVIASEIGSNDRAYGPDLYRSTTSSNVTFPALQLLRLVGVLIAVVLAILLAVSLIVAFWAWLSNEPVWPQLVRAASLAVPSSLVPAGVITAIVGLASKAFTSTHTSERAESDEEFEALFSALVGEVWPKRKLVIFVDELDRCTPSDVVETLDTIRTFFGVPGCVFIVAADQQVLEQAMTGKLRQATPLDDINPYYSAGSSYLDKVFQYQIAVPPLQTKSITRYAAELIEEREGLWQRVNARAVASILVPAHVRSPRRVKHLLNSFVLAFRLAEARAAAGQLDLDVAANAEALARVVCLQVEFPLFARDMVADPDLPSHVLGVRSKKEEYWTDRPGVSELVRKIATSYAMNERAAAAVVAAEDDQSDEVEQVEKSHTDQLLGYLERTNNVQGPYRDLLFLESSGARTTLPTASAMELETAAQNGSLMAVRRVLATFNEDQKVQGLDFLAAGIRDAVGVEVPNFARAILASAEFTELTPDRAEAVLLEVEPILVRDDAVIDAETTTGAWRLAATAASERGRMVAKRIVEQDFVHASDEQAVSALKHYALLDEESQLVASLISDRILDGNVRMFLDQFLEIEEAQRVMMLRTTEEDLAQAIVAAIQAHSSWRKASEPPAPPAGARRSPTVEETEIGPEPFDPAASLEALSAFGQKLDDSETAMREQLVSVLVRIDEQEARNTVEILLDGLKAIQNPLAARVLEAMQRRQTSEWSRWTRPVVVEGLTADPAAKRAVTDAARLLWTRLFRVDSADTFEEYERGVSVVAHLLDDLSDADRRAFGAAALPSARTANDAASASDLRKLLAALRLYSSAGLAAAGHLRKLHLSAILGSLEEDVAAVDIQEVDDAVREALDDFARYSEGVAGEGLTEDLGRISEAVKDSTWLDSDSGIDLIAQILALSPEFAIAHPVLHLGAEEVSSIIAERTPVPSQLLQRWLGYTLLDASAVLGVLKPVLSQNPPALIIAAFSAWVQKQPSTGRLAISEQFLGATEERRWEDSVLHALRLSDLESQDLIGLLEQRYEAETTNEGRTYLLRVWASASPLGDATRRTLIEGLLVPMLRLNQGAADNALSWAGRVAKPVPSGSKQALRGAVIQASERSGLTGKADRLLSELGLAPRPKPRLFSHRK